MFHNMSGEVGNIPAWNNVLSAHKCKKIQEKKLGNSFYWKSLGTAYVKHVSQAFLGTIQWPVSSEIFSVNYILSINVTSSETNHVSTNCPILAPDPI